MKKQHHISWLRLGPSGPKDKRLWWYEDERGIDIHVPPNKQHVAYYLSWRSIRAALARKDRT